MACCCEITSNPDLFLAILENLPLEPFHDAVRHHLEDCVGEILPTKSTLEEEKELKDEFPPETNLGRKMSTVTTVVIEKRHRVLNLPTEKEEKETFLSPLFRYSRDYKVEKRRLEKLNASSTFLRVIRSTFEKYKMELEAISTTSIAMYEEQKEMDTFDNSVAVMMSLCEMCKSEVVIIEKKLASAETNESAMLEDERHSICRLMDTLVKMLDELKNEIVRIRRIDENGFHSFEKRTRQQRQNNRVEHFV